MEQGTRERSFPSSGQTDNLPRGASAPYLCSAPDPGARGLAAGEDAAAGRDLAATDDPVEPDEVE